MSAAESEMVGFFSVEENIFFPTVELWHVAQRWSAWTDEWNLKPNQLPSSEPAKHQARLKSNILLFRLAELWPEVFSVVLKKNCVARKPGRDCDRLDLKAREKRLRDLVTDVTVSLANGISVDAALAALLSELDSIFTFKEEFSWWGTRIHVRCCTLHFHRSMLKHFYCCLTWWMSRIQAETHRSVVPGWTFLASGFLCTYLQLNGRYWLLRR